MERYEEEMIKSVNENADRAAKLREQFGYNKPNNINNPTVKQKYETVAKKSIKRGPTKTSTSKTTDKTVSSAKVAIITCALVSLFAVGVLTTFGANSLFNNQITTKQEINRSSEALKTKAKLNLLYHNLAGLETETNNVEVRNNTVNDYRILNVNKSIDVYMYWKILPSQEFNKFIQSVTYTEPQSDTIYEYTDFDQFLRINGYFYKDSELCIPSKEVFENYMEAYIKDNYKELLEEYEYKYGNPSYTFEQVIPEYEEPTKKGGK